MLDPRPAVWRGCAALVTAACVAALAPAAARADSAPTITSGPAIAGTAQVGQTLTAGATWTGDPPPSATWRWLRCARTAGTCTMIAGATADTYRVAADDAGAVLRVRLQVTNSAGTDEARSAPTAVVAPAPAPTPTPTPSPTATPAPTATPTPAPTATPTPTPAPSPSPVATPTAVPAALKPAATVTPPRLLDPFPVVRIKGVLTPLGARVTLFTVRAPRRARVTVVCRGHGCPLRRWRPPPGSARLRPFERSLRAGTTLTVAVTRPGFVGKLTVIVIRRGAPPRRTDRCLVAARPVRCGAV